MPKRAIHIPNTLNPLSIPPISLRRPRPRPRPILLPLQHPPHLPLHAPRLPYTPLQHRPLPLTHIPRLPALHATRAQLIIPRYPPLPFALHHPLGGDVVYRVVVRLAQQAAGIPEGSAAVGGEVQGRGAADAGYALGVC